MAGELQRQQKELERTHRLEAWAEMARQVAHEIKNPLTPIQLNAEHLRRVHADRGRAAQPRPRGMRRHDPHAGQAAAADRVGVLELRLVTDRAAVAPSTCRNSLHESVDPYRLGLRDRIQFDVDVPATLPPVYVDRTLVAARSRTSSRTRCTRCPAQARSRVVARAGRTPSCRSACRIPASAWTPKRSRARSSRTSRPRPPARDSACRSRSGTSSSTAGRSP